MILTTSDYLEYYLTLVGWIVNNGIWDMLLASGIFAIPFAFIVIQEWLRARAEGADEGNKGVLSSYRIENRAWAAMLVILFGCIPMKTVSFSTIRFDTARSAQCGTSVSAPDDTRWANAFTTLNGQSAKVPVWWFFVHSLSRAVTGAAVAAIPCGVDLRQMRMDIDATRINDPLLAQEVSDFTRDCYAQSRARLFMNRPALTQQQLNDVSWIGSRYFIDTPGFYDNYHASRALDAWPYSPARDAGLAEVTGGGGYPTCTEWWLDSGRGLRDRLLGKIEPSLLTQFASWAGFLSQAEVEDSLIRTIASPKQVMNRGAVYADYGGHVDKGISDHVTRGVSDVGLAFGALKQIPAIDAVRRAVPMILSLIKMTLVVCIPLVLLIGTYDLKAFMTVTCVQFGLFFVEFWFQLARWVDSTVLDALYGWDSPHANFNPLMGIDNFFGDAVLTLVMGAMFIGMPVIWVSALGWVGFQAAVIVSGLSKASAGAQAAGGGGVGAIMKMLGTAIKKN